MNNEDIISRIKKEKVILASDWNPMDLTPIEFKEVKLTDEQQKTVDELCRKIADSRTGPSTIYVEA